MSARTDAALASKSRSNTLLPTLQPQLDPYQGAMSSMNVHFLDISPHYLTVTSTVHPKPVNTKDRNLQQQGGRDMSGMQG